MDAPESGELVAQECFCADKGGVKEKVVVAGHGLEDLYALFLGLVGCPEAYFIGVFLLASEGAGVFVGVGVVLEDLGDVAADGPVVVCFDGDTVCGVGEYWG